MGRNYSSAVISAFVICNISACAFDPPESKLTALGKEFYLSIGGNGDGPKIMYSFKQNLYEVIASDCVNVYCDSNIIVYSTNSNDNDTSGYQFYQLEKIPDKKAVEITKEVFEKERMRLVKIL